MAFAVFEIKKSDKPKWEQALEINVKDPATGKLVYDKVADLLRKQTIVVKEGQSLGLEEGYLYVLVEGSDEALKHARDRVKAFGGQEAKDAEAIRQKIKDEEEAAAGGVGFIFG
ncbi:MAG TPA: hypothetical protein VM681_02290 [Candidatus Thermoplasmatota archaeon]|nr:hypothetical protein [Candidatus Thermoplasmatota archaeon]